MSIEARRAIGARFELKGHYLRQLRQPRIAEIIAGSLRDDILGGRLKEGDLLPKLEDLLKQFRASMPAVREAMRILETDGLITVRRGNVGGAVVHLPTPERAAQITSMVLQSRGATLNDVSEALLQIEPICARMCAARPDRLTEVVPDLRAVIETQWAQFDEVGSYNNNARLFHETLVAKCGNETMIVVVGSLEAIWSAHESSVWDEVEVREFPPDSPMASKTRRAAIRDHEKVLAAIEAGNEERAGALSARHLTAARQSTLASSTRTGITANLLSDMEMLPARQAVRLGT